MKTVRYSGPALRTLSRIPANQAAFIRSKITQYAEDPKSLAQNVLKLKGRDGFRLRVGDWRVIFDEGPEVVAIEKIGARGQVYD